MAIEIGTQSVSDTQKGYLSRAKRNPTSEDAMGTLLAVCRDRDITSGREFLHPDWREIFEANADELQARLGSSEYAHLEEVFSSAQPYDPETLEIDPNATNVTFLLGAGASKPSPSDIPTVTELLPDLLQRARRIGRQDLDRLADFCDESGITNIEDLLTAAQLSEFCSRTPTVLRLVDFLIYQRRRTEHDPRFARSMRQSPIEDVAGVAFLQDTLQLLFGLLSSRMLPAEPNAAHTAIASYVRKNPETSIITTNYDCCMDLALGAKGGQYSYLVDFANRETDTAESLPGSSLIKLHGSLNWFYCDTCQKVYQIDIKKTVKEYMKDDSCYSIIAVCKDCGGQRRGLLVPPLAMKFDQAPPLTPLIEWAQKAFDKADTIVAVGFSFADADLYISRMLTKALQASQNTKLVVFDPDYGVVERLRRQLSLRITKFDPKRVLRVAYDCSKSVPAFLSGKLKTLDASRPTVRTKPGKTRRKSSGR